MHIAIRAYPFDRLIDDLNLKRDTARNPVFDIMAVLQNIGDSEIESTLYSDKIIDDGEWISKVDIECVFQEVKDGIIFNITYNPDVYEGKVMKRFMNHYKQLLQHILSQPEQAIKDVQYLHPEEISAILEASDNTKISYPKEATIVDLFEEQVAATPHQVAVKFEDHELTYHELNERSNQLAHYLKEKYQIGPDDLISLKLQRSERMIIAILGILKAGGAYLPIDPDYPEERINYMVSDSACKLLLDEIEFKQFQELADTFPTSNPIHKINAANLAYVIYTSGSTGNPKGVLIEHKNVVRLLKNDGNLFDFSGQDTWSMFHSYCFDFSVWEMYGALLFGGRLVIVPAETTKDPKKYLQLLIRERVSILNQTPSVFLNLIKEDLASETSDLQLRYVIFGGEALSPGKLKRWSERHPTTRLINMYGITETTVHVTYKEIGITEIEKDQSNIGIPIPTLSTYILDRDQNLLPMGVPGELYVGGAGLARAYLNRPQLTSQRFIPNPFNPAERLYRSGDQAVLLPNGEMEYKGRIDEQVKIRGYRIELGEIEHFLTSKEDIEKAVVLAVGDTNEERSLAAYVVSKQTQEISALRLFLKERLPGYMVPAYFVQLDHIPITSNGKTDRKALLALVDKSMAATSQYVAPRNETEQLLVDIWQKVLRRDRIGIEDNFFELGGDSMKSIQVVVQIKKQLEKDINVSQLYTHQTIQDLSGLLSDGVVFAGVSEEHHKGLKILETFKEKIVAEIDSLPIDIAPYQDIYPLTNIEQGMIYSSRMRPAEPVYYDQFNYSLQVENFDSFKEALFKLVDRHAILRTKYFTSSFQEPAKIVYEKVEVPFSFEDLANDTPKVKQQKVNAFIEKDMAIRLQFDNELLWRIKVFRIQANEYVLFVNFSSFNA